MTTAKERKLLSNFYNVESEVTSLNSNSYPDDFFEGKLSDVVGQSVNGVEQKLSSSQIVKYSTAGDGNCFFHAVFGDNSSGPYKAERAQDMRMEWHKFLSQFKSLNDSKMPKVLKERLLLVFHNVFPTEELHFYTSNLYKRYLNEMSKQGYFVYVEEVPILASLANVKIDIHSPDLAYVQEIQPDPHMVNVSYEKNQELWGGKAQETIYLEGYHYSRAKVITKEIQEQEDFQLAKKLQLDEILEYCNLSKDISERAEVEKRFDELLAENADGKICDVVEQCVSDIKQRIERSEKQNPSSLPRCGMEETRVEAFHQQQPILVK
ncbi:hypothetical protein [Wolbachia endosymbiont of Dactylopius coccus]|nr:MAG: hypothetical protein TV42_01170 [Wolbachia endosymbiont of Dactylopius coccus]